MEWDLAQLRALTAAVEGGSLEAAARTLHVTPSAVSQRLRALEREVGAVLLRRTRPVGPTEAGLAVLRLARQLELLAADAEAELARTTTAGHAAVRIAVNADSLATWVLPALAPLAQEVAVEFLREDQDHTADLLRDGTAMAAVTSEREPVQGCTVERLGIMRYLPMASPAFAARHFPGGFGAAELAAAPVVVYDASDRLQHTVLERWGVTGARQHLVPASSQYAEAIRLGYGWGMLPQLQVAGWPAGDVVVVDEAGGIDVTLYWQQWSLRTATLERVADALRQAASRVLLPRLDTDR